MGGLTLLIGTRNYSSWSLRAWHLLRHLGLPFAERQIHFGSGEWDAEMPKLSPTRRVPVLFDGGLRIWESLAICEYAAELAGRGWPADRGERATARAIAAEMHSGFGALRSACPMNARATGRRVPMSAPLERDIRRVDAIWSGCRRERGDRGPWLFGEYGVADAMFAPVALRVRTYGLPLSALAASYHETQLSDPALVEWVSAAGRESIVCPEDEVGAGA